MRITIGRPSRVRTPGTLHYQGLSLICGSGGSETTAYVKPGELTAYVKRWLASLPSQPGEVFIKCHVAVWGPRGGLRRLPLGVWRDGASVESFLGEVKARFATVPRGDLDRPERQDGWIDDEDLPCSRVAEPAGEAEHG